MGNARKDCDIPRLAIVLPCYNEQEAIEYVVTELIRILDNLVRERLISADSYLFFVDDGSTDNSWALIESLNVVNTAVKGLKLSRNFGHQAALLAGLNTIADKCDVSVSIDADLQQDPSAIRDFVVEYKNGADVVLGIRRDRGTDSWFKKQSATGYYSLMSLMGVKITPNHADYRLLSRRAMKSLSLFSEPNILLRVTCMNLGFRVSTVYFDVKERLYGETKYTLKKMLQLALHGISSYSIVPLRIVAVIGFLLFLGSLIMAGYIVWHALIIGDTVPGWASTTLPIYFIGGVQLLCLGVVGEYVGQIFSAVKKRPRWICELELD